MRQIASKGFLILAGALLVASGCDAPSEEGNETPSLENDRLAHARELARRLRGGRVKVNLIPLNPAPEIPFDAPLPEAVDAFCAVLAAASVTVSVRRPRGRDILAACGQLRLKGTGASVGG